MTIDKIKDLVDVIHDDVNDLDAALKMYEYLCANNIQIPMEEAHRLTTIIMESWDKIKQIVNED